MSIALDEDSGPLTSRGDWVSLVQTDSGWAVSFSNAPWALKGNSSEVFLFQGITHHTAFEKPPHPTPVARVPSLQ